MNISFPIFEYVWSKNSNIRFKNGAQKSLTGFIRCTLYSNNYGIQIIGTLPLYSFLFNGTGDTCILRLYSGIYYKHCKVTFYKCICLPPPLWQKHLVRSAFPSGGAKFLTFLLIMRDNFLSASKCPTAVVQFLSNDW